MNIFTEQPKLQMREFSDAMVRRFLLAQLRAGKQRAFERALFTDPELEQRARLAEIELTDDYVFGRLRRFEMTEFEKRFLCNARRAETLSASRALKQRFEHGEQALAVINSRALPRPLWQHPVLRLAFTALLIVLLFGTTWLVVKKEPQIKRAITSRLTPKRAPAQPAPMETHHATNSSETEHQETPQPLPEHGTLTPRASTFSLSPNNPETAPTIPGASGEYDLIQFQLNVGPESVSRYAVEVLTMQGQSIYAGSAEPDSASTVKFTAARSLFQTGEFEIRLMDENSRARQASYYFRVK